MLKWALALLLAAAGSAAVVAPALDMASSRVAQASSSDLAPLREQLASPTPIATATAAPTTLPEVVVTPQPEETAAPSASLAATRRPEPTRTAKATVPEPTRKPQPATAVDQAAWEVILRVCFGRELDTQACFRALSANGVSLAQLKERISARLHELARRQPAVAGLELLIKACIATKDIESEACAKAWRASGLSLADFRAKIAAKLEAAARSELEMAIRKCLDSHELYGAACYRAWQLSGLSSADFDAKITAEWRAREARSSP